MKKYIFLFLIGFSCSCSHYTADIEIVLKQAGSNRRELESVLAHYASNPADSQKLRAAEFLIANMPGKYSEYYDAPWNDVSTACLRWSSSTDKQRVADVYKIGNPVVQEDIKCITADYLINNIELAFKVWRESPWGKYISFDVFCEEILPYRLGTEPLENWREKALAIFTDLEDVLKRPDMTAIKACETVNNVLPRFRIDKDFPFMNFSQLMATTRGPCDDMAALGIFSMRALGIPTTFEYSPRWVDRPNAHWWNTVRDSSGQHVRFMGAGTNPYQYELASAPCKVYRLMYALQPNIQTTDNNIPLPLRAVRNMKDVTDEYLNTANVAIQLPYLASSPTGYVYLAFEDECQWHPVAWTADSGQTAHFTAMRKNMLYLPIYYADEFQTPAGDPFWLDNEDNLLTFSSDIHNNSDTLLILHEIMRSENRFRSFLKMGVFEGSNKPDFSDTKVLYTIPELPEPFYNEITLHVPASYRYIRYKSPKNSRCQMAEIVFYNPKNEKLDGKVIGTPGAWKNSNKTIDKVFDNDVSTYYEAAEEGSWVGLDLNERKTISKIRYLPRTDANSIYEGHVYELFYWCKDQWRSLGRQTAGGNTLLYRLPTTALCYLENVTLRKKGTTFFITTDKKN
jgi:hypothetical protein